MRKRYPCLIVVLLLRLGITVSAQQIKPDSVIKKFDLYRKEVLHEKIYAHLDRTFYLTGETLWAKLYDVDASFHQALNVSKVAYLEILDKDNDAVLQTKIELKDGTGDGSLFLPASLTSGNYTVRVYTHWMKNFDPQYFFHQSITIVNSFIKLESSGNPAKSYDAQFFPEGGDLVNGLQSKVAFRVTDSFGQGIEFHGAVINEHNDTLSRLAPFALGIGHFSFTPSANEKYRVIIKDRKGNHSSYSLPEVKSSGSVMLVEDKGDIVEVKVSSYPNESTLVSLFVHTRGIMGKAETKISQSGTTVFQVNKKELADGISHFTIFNSAQQPVAERLYFKPPSKKLHIVSQSVQKHYEPRTKVTLNLQTSLPANLSLAVYNVDSLPSLPRESILHYLLLTSELKGKIESPEFYFDEANPKAAEALDNLMLTHGWRRFNWADVLSRKISLPYIPEYRNHFLSGKIVNTRGEPAVGIMTYMASPDKVVNLYGSRSNSRGEFFYETAHFYGDRKVIVQTNFRVDSTYRLSLNSPFSDQYASFKTGPFALSPALQKQLLSRSISMQLHNIYFREEANRTTPIAIDSIPFYGKPDETYRLDDFTRFPIMEEVMREYVPGVLVRKRKDGFHFMVLDNVNKSVFREDPMILLDGVPVFNVDKIMAFDPLKVKKLDVLDREYYLGQLVFPGLVSYSTYKGDLQDFPVDEKALVLNYEGLQLHREFFSPKYESQKERNSRLPDHRTLLYWNPNIHTTNGQHSIEFYTSDVSGNFEAVIEGIAKDGTAGHATYSFSVMKSNQ
jgi:hypothetical protein